MNDFNDAVKVIHKRVGKSIGEREWNALNQEEAKKQLHNKRVEESQRLNLILDLVSQMEVSMIPIQTTSMKVSFEQFRGVILHEFQQVNSQIEQGNNG